MNLYVSEYGSAKIRKIVIDTAVVTTLAGSDSQTLIDGTGTAATFRQPEGLWGDASGNLYVADTGHSRIRKLVISSAAVTTLNLISSPASGTAIGTESVARFNFPDGITGNAGNLYVADTKNHAIRKVVVSGGLVTTLAGLPGTSAATDASTGSSARFKSPEGVWTDGTNLYVADTGNHTIRKVVISTGETTTLAGAAGTSGSTNATGASALFSSPTGIWGDGVNLYVADKGNHMIRQIVISTRVVTTLAGSGTAGSANATGTDAQFNQPLGIWGDGSNLYVSEGGNHNIRKIAVSSGVVTTLSGSGAAGSADGAAANAQFNSPHSLTGDGTNLFVADRNNHTIRKVVIDTGAVTTIAGASVSGYFDANGSTSYFRQPGGIWSDGSTLYIADSGNHNIRKLTPP